MALPKLNDVPKYDVTIPSTKQSIRFRPFLVKEQKILLMALETKDEKSILSAITDTLESCIVDPVNLSSFTSFDVEYLFTQIRGKSVGESSTLLFNCTECSHSNEVKIDITEIKIDVPKNISSIKLNDQYMLDMKYPSYMDMLEQETLSESDTDKIYNTIMICLDKLKTEDDIISFSDEPREEVSSFLEQLTTEQFEKVMEFVNNIPTLKHELTFECEQCNHNNKAILQGISDFF